MLPRRRWSWLIVCFLTILLTTAPWHGQAAVPIEQLLQQSQQQYESGKLEDAKILLQTVRQQAQDRNDTLTSAIALSNLALIASQQGRWDEANQAIAASVQSLQTLNDSSAKTTVLAQALNVQGRLQLTQGNALKALESWQRTAKLYQQANNVTGKTTSQLHQAQALQALGLYGRAYQEILKPLREQLQQQPDSPLKVQGLRKVGEGLGVTGNLGEAETIVQESLDIAQRLTNLPETQASQLTLANLISAHIRQTRSASSLKRWEREQLDRNTAKAVDLYQQVAATPSDNQLRANLNLLALLLDSDRSTEAVQLASSLQPAIANLPSDRSGIEARLNFARSLLRLQKSNAPRDETAIALLTSAVKQAQTLQDSRLLANAWGYLGEAQKQNKQLQAAQTSTEQAVLLAKAISAPDQVYRWSAQLGWLQEKQGDRDGAIASYTQAVNTLKTLRTDLLGVNADTLIAEPEALEPVHRQLVSLLLPRDGSQPTPQVLKQTRDIIESLQLEEINNYLRAACVQALVEIDKVPVPQKTTIIYPIILSDRIATIVSVTGQTPTLYTKSVDQETVQATVKALQIGLRNRISLEYQEPSKQLYEWLIQPIAEELQQQKVETLVFVYSIATTPGLKLSDPQPLQAKALSGIAFGLTEPRTVNLPDGPPQTFSELPFVEPELEDLQQEIRPSTVALNQNFTRSQFFSSLEKSQAPIVHLATHGQFSSNRDQTFLLASDGVINIDELATALGGGTDTRTTPIELLVLSACETAAGDDRAPLGLAGMALKSGARSTVASLWKVNDNATSTLMQKFYKEVATRQVTKAVALQQAQRAILDDPQFGRHPYFWAPFILVGNWL
jgi:CHAT domain-containing protein